VRNIVIGPPGTGKTTFLLDRIEEYLEQGVSPERIAYLTFTRKAANEGLNRAVKKFSFDPDELPYFRTIHSLCYRWLNMKRADVIGKENYRELGEILGERITGGFSNDDGIIKGSTVADQMLLLENTARSKDIPLMQQWKEASPDYSWMHFSWLCRSYTEYKKSRYLIDYTDMLEKFLQTKTTPELKVLFIDEAQDLSTLQWECVKKIAANSEEVYIAGDDDQAIYKWAGADVDQFISLKGKEIQLKQSYRIPSKVHELSQQIIKRNKNRRPKEWNAKEEEGSVNYHTAVEHIDMSEGEWLLLSRNNYLLNPIEEYLKTVGVLYERNHRISVRQKLLDAIRGWEMLRKGQATSLDVVKNIYYFMSVGKAIERGKKNLKTADEESLYTLENLKMRHGLLVDSIWHEAFDRVGTQEREYLISCLRKEEKITSPRIKLSTIHAAKGGECDNVVLLTDMANSTWKELGKNPENENRTFYVAVTRTKQNLHVVLPRTHKNFTIAY